MRRAPAAPPAELPAWPFFVLVAGFPVWWVLGLGAFAVAMVAVPMIVLLIMRRTVRLPPAFALWILFVVWAGAAAIELDSSLRLIGFAVRLSNYIGAGVVFVYVYNCSERRLPRRSALLALAGFFAFVVLGGWLGVLLPGGHLTTPAERLLPGSIASNDYVHDLVHPPFAEVQQPYGSPRTFTRPSAPFAYTNGWGCNVALLVPLACAALSATRRRRDRVLIAAVLGAAVVPAVATLNRGMYIALAVGLAYAALRLALRGHVVPLAAIVTAAGVGAAVASAAGVVSSLNERLHYSQTNTGRAQVYREAFEGAVASPLLGNGAPRPSQTLDISIGTQGQIWNVMFSYGFVALFCFVGWLLAAAVVTSRARGVDGVWLHVVTAVSLLTIAYYGYDGFQLTLVMIAAALGMRPADRVDATAETAVAHPARREGLVPTRR